ncbi:MAG: tetratricopeptide repeat-containing glycosyltransferase family protein [Thalassobaculum sp.]|uniref:tetratricopeptide repeat-containing glycosyltransferase family protein n=1 Tax=Thalassobaculum sp. TaxID=2022740 RepID=UPI0032F074D4
MNQQAAQVHLGARPTLEQVEQALSGRPNDPTLLRHRAAIRLDSGDQRGAVADVQKAMAKAGSNADSELLTVAARCSLIFGRSEEAEKLARRGLRRAPCSDALFGVLGGALQRQGKLGEAVAAYDAAVNLNPFRRTFRIALAQALEASGDRDRAERVYRQALETQTGFGDAALNLANLLQSAERFDESLHWYQQTLEMQGLKAPVLSNVGALLRKMGRYDDARRQYRRAMCLMPSDSGVNYNYANLYRAENRIDIAIQHYRRALVIRPTNAELHWNLSLALLADGRLKEGFDEYEWRWKYDSFPSKRRDFPQPLWNGEPFDGRTLLLHTEQGIGDVLQFLRFLPMIVERKGRTGRIVLECHEPLMSLLQGFPGIDEMIERFAPPPPADLHMPLLSAARALGVDTIEQLPNAVPYLPVPAGPDLPIPELDPACLNVGFVFGGNPKFPNDRTRSTRLESWMPLFDLDGVKFFSMQKGDREPELANAPESVVRLNERLISFRDTAVAMGKLDLVITTCTSVAHLAGALGRPFWVVLSRNADWRWLIGRDDSPWYPSARLFRQSVLDDWDGVFARVRAALQAEIEARRRGGTLR